MTALVWTALILSAIVLSVYFFVIAPITRMPGIDYESLARVVAGLTTMVESLAGSH
jgi:hypothetical protein